MSADMSLLSVHSSLGHTDIVTLLLDWGADVNATNDSGVTLSMLTYFLYPHVLGDTALVLAAAGGHTDILEHLTGSGSLETGLHMEDRAVRASAGAEETAAIIKFHASKPLFREQVLRTFVFVFSNMAKLAI